MSDWRQNPNLVETYADCVATWKSWEGREKAVSSFKTALADPYGQRETALRVVEARAA